MTRSLSPCRSLRPSKPSLLSTSIYGVEETCGCHEHTVKKGLLQAIDCLPRQSGRQPCPGGRTGAEGMEERCREVRKAPRTHPTAAAIRPKVLSQQGPSG